jgi:hypothetical protein
MGTSTTFGGGKNSNPLIPSWLDTSRNDQSNDETNTLQVEESGLLGSSQDIPEVVHQQLSGLPDTLPLLSIDNRFSNARRNFTYFINSGGSNRAALGRAIASYVTKTGGGARQAAKRMKSERTASVKLGNILSQASTSGIREVVRSLNLANLANRSVVEIYAALVDIICPSGGDLDDSIARDAYIDAIGEIAEMGISDLEQPSVDTIATIMECFITNAIKDRIMNAIATKIITLPDNVLAVQNIEGQLKDFICGAVSDAITNQGKIFTIDQMSKTIDTLYERSFAVLQALAEQEATQ